MTNVNDSGLNSSILIISLVQSATTFLRNSLSETLGTPVYRRLSGGTWNTTDLLFPVALDELSQTPHVAYTHAHPLPNNMIILDAALDRAILNIRDPRQVVASVIHFIDKYTAKSPVYFAAHQFPAGYMERDYAWKLSYHLEYSYPMLVDWIDGWLKVSDYKKIRTKLLLIQQQELKRDREDYFRRIYRFYGLNNWESIPVPEEHGGPYHNFFRLGRNDEWRELMSSEQIRYANKLIPDYFWERLDWEP